MRVIAGEAKGKRLFAPRTAATRPATDRLRESVFGTLGDRPRGANVLDLFAGSGAFGIEALSRGAVQATFVDREPAAIDAIRRNVLATGFEASANVSRGDAATFLRHTAETYDIVFLDPPYAEVELLALLLAGPDLRRVTRGLLVLRAFRKHAPGIPEQWSLAREREVGEDVVRYLT
ncbi:MAG TPA: 16S rRNA (guanine(966)-N(2))-methyltransferase RsmD [Candidatus Dormibacteraeota bacterium]|nr:16S rRNA (guanine(966)-N(2))-methyltransferase RsmD [Candidatus Dormibacteraeota bacterium]